ncbi:MAG TPA: 2-oxoacid:ferredoxin oxidoreductase subunit gamma [Nitrospiraceae bacterium]|nr:2-oxoacid:ferredoxin oxidoreductase subunit gamma [Nitrospiraceae bacterium]
MENDLLKLIIAGSGGQGILFIGRLLAHAVMLTGKEVTWFPSYGAEIRGGTASCTVIISDEMVASPVIQKPDALIIMNKASLEKFENRLKTGGLLIMNQSLIKTAPQRSDIEVIAVKANDIAEEIGDSRVANVVMLGVLIGKTGMPDMDITLRALREIIPLEKQSMLTVNETALKRGIKEVDSKSQCS